MNKLSESDLENIDPHDAIILEIHTDIIKKLVTHHIAYYTSTASNSRTYLNLKFQEVSYFSSLIDFHQLHNNHSFGNVNHWKLGSTSYIYLVEGCIAVTANKVDGCIVEKLQTKQLE